MLNIMKVERGGDTQETFVKDIELSPSRHVVVWKPDWDAYGILTKIGDDKIVAWFTNRVNVARSYVSDYEKLHVVSNLTKFELVVQQ